MNAKDAVARYREVGSMSAHPVSDVWNPCLETFEDRTRGGLTIRQHFAGLAMQGLLANESLMVAITKEAPLGTVKCSDVVATYAVHLSVSMVRALSQGEGQ